jgi:hypothetical protein
VDLWTVIEKLQAPGLMFAALVIYLGYKLYLRLVTEMHENTVLLSKMSALLDVAVSRLVNARDRDSRGQ